MIRLASTHFSFLIPHSPAAEGEFKPLFNGKNLDGWHNVNCGPKTWTVMDGVIHCTGKPIGELRTTNVRKLHSRSGMAAS